MKSLPILFLLMGAGTALQLKADTISVKNDTPGTIYVAVYYDNTNDPQEASEQKSDSVIYIARGKTVSIDRFSPVNGKTRALYYASNTNFTELVPELTPDNSLRENEDRIIIDNKKETKFVIRKTPKGGLVGMPLRENFSVEDETPRSKPAQKTPQEEKIVDHIMVYNFSTKPVWGAIYKNKKRATDIFTIEGQDWLEVPRPALSTKEKLTLVDRDLYFAYDEEELTDTLTDKAFLKKNQKVNVGEMKGKDFSIYPIDPATKQPTPDSHEQQLLQGMASTQKKRENLEKQLVFK